MKSIFADLVVVGAGPCGFVTALSAIRQGLNVILIDKRAFPGGVISGSGVNSLLTFHSLKGHKIIEGIPQEIIDGLVSIGASLGHIRDTVGVAWSVTPISPSAFSTYIISKCKTEKINLQTNCEFQSVITEEVCHETKRIKSIYCLKDRQPLKISAPLFVDASGEGVLGESAGAELLPMNDDTKMPMTLIFNMGNVDISEVLKYIDKNKDEFHHETLWDEIQNSKIIGVSGFFSLWKSAKLSVPRDRVLFYQTLNKNEVSINSTRIFANSKEPYTEAMEQVSEISGFLKEKIPGFRDSFISNIYPFIGIREGRRLKGHYCLTEEDVLYGKRFPNEIAFGGFPIDIHSSKNDNLKSVSLQGDGFYGIPYGTLVSSNIENLFIAGKCFSAEFSAHASARVQATVMALGQAVGISAGICIKNNILPINVCIDKLRSKLLDDGCILNPVIL